MSIKMVRQPSETPNITNIDDIIPFRYAYGNQNGYVKDKGNEAGYTVNGSQFTIGSGRIVLQGVESDISASGVTITIDSVNELRYYVIYLQVNLALNTVSILSQYDTADYPTISAGDDLTEVSTGIANLPLYKFTANNGVISDIEKVINGIEYIKNIVVDNSLNSQTVQNVDFSSTSPAQFGDYIVGKIICLKNTSVGLPHDTTTTVYETSLADLENKKLLIEITYPLTTTQQSLLSKVEITKRYGPYCFTILPDSSATTPRAHIVEFPFIGSGMGSGAINTNNYIRFTIERDNIKIYYYDTDIKNGVKFKALYELID